MKLLIPSLVAVLAFNVSVFANDPQNAKPLKPSGKPKLFARQKSKA